MSLKSYHRAWLEHHPCRTEAWLQERLSDGFHVHHVDRDHANESRENLVLIEAEDHMRIHGRSGTLLMVSADKRESKERRDHEIGRAAYEHRRRLGRWGDARVLGACGGRAYLLARAYAAKTGKQWPLARLARGRLAGAEPPGGVDTIKP